MQVSTRNLSFIAHPTWPQSPFLHDLSQTFSPAPHVFEQAPGVQSTTTNQSVLEIVIKSGLTRTRLFVACNALFLLRLRTFCVTPRSILATSLTSLFATTAAQRTLSEILAIGNPLNYRSDFHRRRHILIISTNRPQRRKCSTFVGSQSAARI